MVTDKDVIKVLRTCYDPEIPINIYDLGLIYGIDIKDDSVTVRLTLTSRGSPMSATIKYEVTEKIKRIEGCKGAEIEVVWDPPWTPEKMTEDAKRLLGISV